MSDASIDLERVVTLASSLASENRQRRSPLDEPLGPAEECLSSRQIQRFLESGAIESDLPHLVRCNVCRTNISSARLGPELRLDSELIDRMLVRGESQEKARERKEEVRSPLAAIVVTEAREFAVEDPKAPELTVQCSIVPAFARTRLQFVAASSLRLEGALTARGGSIEPLDLTSDGSPDILRLRFDGAHISKRVREYLLQDQRVLDTVRVHGWFQDNPMQEFVGQARLEFVRLQVKAQPATTSPIPAAAAHADAGEMKEELDVELVELGAEEVVQKAQGRRQLARG